ncbi:DUF6223 family protein [Micromonospora sp. NPDC005173]|uniref:DUF6223 family protein n=1 Tax=Micromonospora sp. NPDC005173 TaxID=3157165 RepID=UPI0033B2453E
MSSSKALTSTRRVLVIAGAVLVLVIAGAVLLGTFGLVGPPDVQVEAQPLVANDAYALTTGRLLSAVGALVALAGTAIAGLALARSAGRIGSGSGKRGAIVALVAGVIGIVLGGYVVAAAEGGAGTGYGIVGGFASLVFGLIATALGGLALARSRRTV